MVHPNITVLLADDESHARERMRDLLDEFDQFEIIAEATDGNEALQMIIAQQPQVAFLDINMPGISVFQSLPSLKEPPLIVFQTAYSEHAADAFDIDALDYLLKPIRRERLERTIAKITEKLCKTTPIEAPASPPQESRDKVSVKVNGRIKLIPVEYIIRIAFEKGFSTIYTANERFISDKYLNHYEDILSEKGFFRASRTELIKLDAITAIQNHTQGMYTVELSNGKSVDLSRRKAQALRKIVQF